MEDFKPNLTDDAGDAKRRAAELVRDGLAGLRLEAKIAEVATARRAWLRRRFWQRAIALGIGLLVLGALAFWMLSKKPASEPTKTTPQEPQIQPQIPDNQPAESLPRHVLTRPQTPIAERPQTPRERAERPLLRGAKPELDSTTNQLIDALLKITVYQATNTASWFDPNSKDSKKLAWSNAVYALFQNKPADAKPHIFQLEEMDTLEGQWLLALALLEEGKLEEATVIFRKIAANPNHARRGAAAQAVAALQRD